VKIARIAGDFLATMSQRSHFVDPRSRLSGL